MPVIPHPNESPEYRKQRAELLAAEIELKHQIEREPYGVSPLACGSLRGKRATRFGRCAELHLRLIPIRTSGVVPVT